MATIAAIAGGITTFNRHDFLNYNTNNYLYGFNKLKTTKNAPQSQQNCYYYDHHRRPHVQDTIMTINVYFSSYPTITFLSFTSLRKKQYFRFPDLKLRYLLRILKLSWLLGPFLLSLPLIMMIDKGILERHVWYMEHLTKKLQQAGTLCIKLAQWASSRRDVLPNYICDPLSKLQSKGNPHSLEDTKRIIEQEFGQPINQIFESFDTNPIGVGSVAQVYKAKLRNGVFNQQEQEVAVKVLHPNIQQEIELDLDLLSGVAYILDRLPSLRQLSIADEVRTFSSMMMKQLDLRIEAKNLLDFAHNFKENDDCILFPAPIEKLVSKQVLVESFHPGMGLDQFLKRGPTEFDEKVALTGLNCFLKMVLRDNFAHADLHAGNILISFERQSGMSSGIFSSNNSNEVNLLNKFYSLKTDKEFQETVSELFIKGYTPKLIVLDAGLTSTLSQKNANVFKQVFEAGSKLDGRTIVQVMIHHSKYPERVVDHDKAKEYADTLVRKVKMDQQGKLLLSQVNSAELVTNFTSFLQRHHIRMDGEFISVCIACLLVEGIGRKLCGEIDVMEAVAEHFILMSAVEE